MLQAPTRMGLAATLHPGARRLHGGRRKLVVPHSSPIGFVDRKGPAACCPFATVCGDSAPRHRGTPRLASAVGVTRVVYGTREDAELRSRT